ncbi:alcohol dehydrogenase catalytic domain-containing protein [Streptomyces sp. M19]
MAVCGICQSDLSQLDGHITPRLPVVTPGHEASGTVAAVGEGGALAARRPRGAGRGPACGACSACKFGGGTNTCEDLQVMAFHYDGAWAEYVLTDATTLIEVPDTLPWNTPPSWPTRCPPRTAPSRPPVCAPPSPSASGAWAAWGRTWSS